MAPPAFASPTSATNARGPESHSVREARAQWAALHPWSARAAASVDLALLDSTLAALAGQAQLEERGRARRRERHPKAARRNVRSRSRTLSIQATPEATRGTNGGWRGTNDRLRASALSSTPYHKVQGQRVRLGLRRHDSGQDLEAKHGGTSWTATRKRHACCRLLELFFHVPLDRRSAKDRSAES